MTFVSIASSRFGTIDAAPDALVTFPDGLIGFPDARRFVAVPHRNGSPFVWLQSAEKPELAFLLVSPALVQPDYSPPLLLSDGEKAERNDQGNNAAALWAIVTVPPGRPRDMTANLLGPLIIQGNTGRQIILDGEYTTRHPVLPQSAPAKATAGV